MSNKTKELPLDEEQQKAYDIALGGDNLFLTGDAGTGKSFVLNRIIKGLEKDPRRTVLVCAPTGIAALNIGGTTIYSLLGIRPQTDLLNAPSNRVSGHVMDKLDFLYTNLHLQTIPELLMTSGISSGTPNNFRVTAY